MSQLYFKKPFQDAIRAGTKTTTIRRWARPMVKVGRNSFSPGLGWLAIEAVEVIQIESLDDADATADGFDTAVEMRRRLIEFYPGHCDDDKSWFRVRFRVHELQVRGRKVNSDEANPA